MTIYLSNFCSGGLFPRWAETTRSEIDDQVTRPPPTGTPSAGNPFSSNLWIGNPLLCNPLSGAGHLWPWNLEKKCREERFKIHRAAPCHFVWPGWLPCANLLPCLQGHERFTESPSPLPEKWISGYPWSVGKKWDSGRHWKYTNCGGLSFDLARRLYTTLIFQYIPGWFPTRKWLAFLAMHFIDRCFKECINSHVTASTGHFTESWDASFGQGSSWTQRAEPFFPKDGHEAVQLCPVYICLYRAWGRNDVIKSLCILQDVGFQVASGGNTALNCEGMEGAGSV